MLLLPTFQMKKEPRILAAGQITGVEGYVESAASGFLAGLNAARLAAGAEPVVPPDTTAMGSLVGHITNGDVKQFQPMNVNYGLFPELPGRVKKKERRALLAERALLALDQWIGQIEELG
jgi:methylenetetrahydrofolate--tRNA-(uracil-5-)-methyltransferase